MTVVACDLTVFLPAGAASVGRVAGPAATPLLEELHPGPFAPQEVGDCPVAALLGDIGCGQAFVVLDGNQGEALRCKAGAGEREDDPRHLLLPPLLCRREQHGPSVLITIEQVLGMHQPDTLTRN